jgi:hypothetical protein
VDVVARRGPCWLRRPAGRPGPGLRVSVPQPDRHNVRAAGSDLRDGRVLTRVVQCSNGFLPQPPPTLIGIKLSMRPWSRTASLRSGPTCLLDGDGQHGDGASAEFCCPSDQLITAALPCVGELASIGCGCRRPVVQLLCLPSHGALIRPSRSAIPTTELINPPCGCDLDSTAVRRLIWRTQTPMARASAECVVDELYREFLRRRA